MMTVTKQNKGAGGVTSHGTSVPRDSCRRLARDNKIYCLRMAREQWVSVLTT